MDKRKLIQELKDLKLILTDKELYKQEILERYKDSLNGIEDFLGDGYDDMSTLFYLVNRRYLHWMSNDPDEAVLEREVKFRRKFYELLKVVGPKMMGCTQVIENRNIINDPSSIEPDNGVILPDKPVIFVANHGFRDDVLATVLAAKRHAYLYCGSLPLFYNSFNGYATSLVGQIMTNRKNKNSRVSSIDKSYKAMQYGTDIILFPEGGWNKTKEELVLNLWIKGVYELSNKGRFDVVPIVHYNRDMEIVDKKNVIHTIIDNPIPFYEMEQDEAIAVLRNTMASWVYKMAEIYGQSTRDKEIAGFSNSDEKWHDHLKKRMVFVDRYDSTIERIADFRPKDKVRIEDVFKPIANVKNITKDNVLIVEDAKKLVKEKKETDFQRLY